MAYLITPNGLGKEVSPANGEIFTLEELQGYVGGFIEHITMPYGAVVMNQIYYHAFVNEEGKLQSNPVNPRATLAWEAGNGRPLGDVLVGNVLFFHEHEVD